MMIVVGGRMAFAAQTDEATGSTCTLIVPPHPLSAKGLATPYELAGPCHEADPDTAAFVQGTIIDPVTGNISVYNPLVVDRGTRPAVAPTPPALPAAAVVGLWFGFNGDNLVLRGTQDSLAVSRCVNGLDRSLFGQFGYCNAPAFFEAANAAVAAGKLTVPPPGTARDGLPCPTVRDFGLVDMDQSDNVTSSYLFLADGSTAQNTAANQAALAGKGARILINGSDNALLDDFVDPALGCTPYTAPDLAQPGRTTTSLALNELQATAYQPMPVALVPMSDPMVQANGAISLRKTNLYRAGVGQRPVDTAADTTQAYCRNLVQTGPARLQLDRRFTQRRNSPNSGVATNLFTFLAQRLAGTFDALNCGTVLDTKNPVTVVTDRNGAAVDARFATVVPPSPVPSGTPQPTRSASAAPMPTASATPTRSASPTPTRTTSAAPTRRASAVPSRTASPTPTPSATRDIAAQAQHSSAPPNGAAAATPNPVPTAAQDPDQPTVPEQVPAPPLPSDDGALTADQPPAGAESAPAQTAPPAGALPAAPAPVHHVAAGIHKLPVTGSTLGAGLAVAGVLLAAGLGLRGVHTWRRRQWRVIGS